MNIIRVIFQKMNCKCRPSKFPVCAGKGFIVFLAIDGGLRVHHIECHAVCISHVKETHHVSVRRARPGPRPAKVFLSPVKAVLIYDYYGNIFVSLEQTRSSCHSSVVRFVFQKSEQSKQVHQCAECKDQHAYKATPKEQFLHI